MSSPKSSMTPKLKRLYNFIEENKHVVVFLVCVIILLVIVIVFYKFVVDYRISHHPPALVKLSNGLNSKLEFKNKYLRLLAERIYDYRVATEYKIGSTDDFVSIFLSANKDKTPPIGVDLNDIALYKLATASSDRFNILISYIPVFNHPRYVECMLLFDKTSQTFKSKDPLVSTRSIIINSVLGISDSVINDLRSNQSDYALNSSIINVLESSSDSSLYILLSDGFIGA